MSLAEALHDLSDDELIAVRDHLSRYEWRGHARTTAGRCQVAPAGQWRHWYVRGGRGSGKTWAGANNFAEMVLDSDPGEWAVIAPTYGDARDVCIESAKSGLIKALGGKAGPNGVLIEKGPWIATWNRSMGDLRLTNGSVIYADGADDGALRIQGKNLSGAWCDEIGLWKRWETAWDESIRYAVRIHPGRIIATGTPKRNLPARTLVKRLLDDPKVPKDLLLTEDNAANLDAATLEDLLTLAGTTLGRQELEGELLEDIEGALWTLALIDEHRVERAPRLDRIVVSVDPAGTAAKSSDETGIIIAGQRDGHGYVLDDISGRYTPDGWGRAACLAYVSHDADAIVFERNNGHDMGPHIIRSSWVELEREGSVDGIAPRVVDVWATRGKAVRAEPLVAQYEQGRWHHVGALATLEDQLCAWTPGDRTSPDRMDALVWAAWELTVKSRRRAGLIVRDEPVGFMAEWQAKVDLVDGVEPEMSEPRRRGGLRVRV